VAVAGLISRILLLPSAYALKLEPSATAQQFRAWAWYVCKTKRTTEPCQAPSGERLSTDQGGETKKGTCSVPDQDRAPPGLV
jgi:hypothetical protein